MAKSAPKSSGLKIHLLDGERYLNPILPARVAHGKLLE
jgi:hypothetical protein